jgi:uncharacterized protein
MRGRTGLSIMPVSAPESVRLFPLPGVVLFPGAVLPLRVFEPRYLRLLNDALQSDRLIGMPQIDPAPKHFTQPNENPSLLPVMGVGRVIAQDQLSDGTWHIALLGQGRFRIEDEQPHTPYRLARVVPIPDALPESQQKLEMLLALKQRVLRLADALTKRTLEAEARDQLLEALKERRESGPICDLLASIFVQDSAVRQALLESADVLLRTQLVLAILSKLSARADIASKSGASPDGICLN